MLAENEKGQRDHVLTRPLVIRHSAEALNERVEGFKGEKLFLIYSKSSSFASTIQHPSKTSICTLE
jgi:hypothetical protein